MRSEWSANQTRGAQIGVLRIPAIVHYQLLPSAVRNLRVPGRPRRRTRQALLDLERRMPGKVHQRASLNPRTSSEAYTAFRHRWRVCIYLVRHLPTATGTKRTNAHPGARSGHLVMQHERTCPYHARTRRFPAALMMARSPAIARLFPEGGRPRPCASESYPSSITSRTLSSSPASLGFLL